MVSGETVYSKIKEKISEVENSHERLGKRIYNAETKIENLTTEREEIFTKLAAVYLPEIDADHIQKTLTEVQRDVQAIFRKKQARRQELEQLMSSSTGEKRKTEETLEALTMQLNAKAAERDKLQTEIGKELGENSEYSELHTKAKQAENRLIQNKERVEEAKSDSEKKLPAFENSKSFTYLLERRFGTENYVYGGIVKKLDGWVAKLINHSEAKSNYDFLRAMPQLMELEVKRREEELEETVVKVKAFEKEKADKYGLTKVLEEGIQLGRQRENIISQVKQLDEQYNEYAKERKETDSTKDSYHKEAIQKLKSFLKSDGIADLKTRARGSEGSEDDKLVRRLEEIDISIRSLKDDAKQLKTDRDEVGENLSGLNDVKSNYTSKDYESDRSYFDEGFDINALLVGYITGQFSSSDVWDDIKEHHHFKPEETHSKYSDYGHYGRSSRRSPSHGYGGSSNRRSPSYDDSSSHRSSSSDSGWGGGFGGGSFGGGSGFGGGGFSSGKGF